ncbi:hypothetical protein THAOC_06515 [Thalassiosira oceanica]|uniref:Uncharacterized protein n=1 Tax=Thalassiosira oceanica TaxID=159749 RepID=K0T4A7_THAOC|nr:hypothetical protein THAOC_06515 [Thalassiosira oceanica]|eukprot:EJK71994.1 hypothetical protein THAOC_06515 [Thalassiosira oceanica]
MHCELFDESYCGNKVKQEVTKWNINDYRSDPDQALSDLFVDQQHRLDEIKDIAENHMHHRGALWDEAAMIDLLRNRTPEYLWDWMRETGVDPDDGVHTALDLAAKLDHKHKQAIKKKKKKAEKKKQKNEKLDNNEENKRANADVDNRSNKRRCLHSDRDDDSDAINESSYSDEESSSGDEQSSSGDERSSDDEILSDDDGSREDDGSKVDSDDDSYSSDHRNSTATKQAPAHGDTRVVLLNGMDCTWKNCPVNPESDKFDWEAAKLYMFKDGGRYTWYADVFHEESRKRRAARQPQPQPQSHFQAPAQGPQYHPYYPPVPQAYHQQYMPSHGPSPGQAQPTTSSPHPAFLSTDGACFRFSDQPDVSTGRVLDAPLSFVPHNRLVPDDLLGKLPSQLSLRHCASTAESLAFSMGRAESSDSIPQFCSDEFWTTWPGNPFTNQLFSLRIPASLHHGGKSVTAR